MTQPDFPTIIEKPANVQDLSATLNWLASQRQSMIDTLATSGAILFRGFPIHTAEDFDAFSAAFGYDDFTYAESLSNAVRINLTPRVFTANEAPPDVEIFLHHEMAQTPIYPQKIFFCCLSAAASGGATPLCRSDLLYQAFKDTRPEWAEQFEKLGVQYTTHMPADDDAASGQGRSWRSTLSVDTKAAAQERLTELGYSWQWQPDDSLQTTTPTLPAVRKLNDGSQSFFNQVIAAYRGWKRSNDSSRPTLSFGNGEAIAQEILDYVTSLAADFTYPLQWQDGDIALVDNYRVMHGRYPYSGTRPRKVVVCLARDT